MNHIILFEGKLVVFIFNENGEVIRMIKMGEYQSGHTVLYRLCSDLWHFPMAITEQVVYHEILTGPFIKEETVEYAKWAPEENDEIAGKIYMKGLLEIYHNSSISQKE